MDHPVRTGQPRTPQSNELPSSAALTARCNTPSKLVMRRPGIDPAQRCVTNH